MSVHGIGLYVGLYRRYGTSYTIRMVGKYHWLLLQHSQTDISGAASVSEMNNLVERVKELHSDLGFI